MVDQRSDPHVFAPLCAKTSAPVRRISSIYVFSAHLLLRCASWLQSALSSNAAAPLMTTSAAMFALLHVLDTIPIDNRYGFTQTL
jgi:hypothetical protein